MKSVNRETMEGTEVSNQKRMWTLGEKENYLEILEVDSTKDERKNKKRVNQKCLKTSRKQALHQKSHQKNRHLGCISCKLHWAIL